MPSSPASNQPSRRIALLDGFRGAAIVLIVLSHGWTLWPIDGLWNSAARVFFFSGNFAVSIFFVISMFLATRRLLARTADTQQPQLRPGVELVRRFIRLSAQLYVVVLAVVVVAALDPTDQHPPEVNRQSMLHIATFSWNWHLQDNAMTARPDLGHLWYLSVEFQVFLLVLALVYFLRHRPAWLLASLIALLIASIMWRAHVYETEGVYQALLRTTVRMEAPLSGAAAAAALPYLGRLTKHARLLATLAALALVPLALATTASDGYFGWPGILLSLTLAVLLASITLAAPPRWLDMTLGSRVPAFVGRYALSIYLWHYPVFWFISRHTFDWTWQEKTVVGFIATAVLVGLSDLLIERPLQRFLRAPLWTHLEAGVIPYLRTRWSQKGART